MHLGLQHWDTQRVTVASGTVPAPPVPHVTRITDTLVRAEIAWNDRPATEGWGRDAARAVSEAVERAACARLPAHAFRARATDLAHWLHPDAVVRYTDAQYASAAFPFRRFDARQERWWVDGQLVESGVSIAVPAELACLPRAFAAEERNALFTYATTSGCATDASIATALERALFELVERDAFMRHWWAQLPGRAVGGVQCLHLGVHPTWLAWARDEEAHFTCVGTASGADAEAALAQALHERDTALIAQGTHRNIQEQQVRGPADHAALYATRHYFRRADAVLFAQREITFEAAAVRFARTPRLPNAICVSLDFDEALAAFGLHTVRALVPGLVPIAFGYGLQPLGLAAAVAPGAHALHPFC